jgi:mannose-1-phosphate guanylyltransferase
MIYTVIMAGGKGERFWPFSTRDNPKQMLRIVSEKSMLQDTIERVIDYVPLERTLVVTGHNLRQKILDRFDFLKKDNLLVEPVGKNTCLAIGLAAVHLRKLDPESVMIVLSADHYIKPKERLLELLRVGTTVAVRDDVLITIGINPTRPETAYGYIQVGELYSTFDGISTYKVARFKEKPNRELAQEYYLDRRHLWNSGMFIWSTSAILKAIGRCQPVLAEQLTAYAETIGTEDERAAREKLFASAENISIDVAVLERAENVLVIKASLIWDDIGSWRALERINPKDRQNNMAIGRTLLHDSYEVTAVNASGGLVTTLGVSDLVIVKTDKVVLVAHKTKVDELKELLDRLRQDDELANYL